MLKENKNVTYGTQNSDYMFYDLKMDHLGSSFKIKGKANLDIKTKLIGRYNIYNLVDSIVLL